MNYQETEAYLLSKLPMFQRIGPAAYKKDLERIRVMCEFLGQPHEAYPAIHIAGTNGKGSTAHTLAAILQSNNYKTGLFTSPHLRSYTERVKINGEEIEKEAVVEFVQKIKPLIEEIEPSFFEVTTAMGFWYFREKGVDIAVIETGMGGRLDSTNVLNPLFSLITTIGYDHQQFLGDTIEKIAFEKAGIIKEGKTVIVGTNTLEAIQVFENKAKELNVTCIIAQEKFDVKWKEYVGLKRRFAVKNLQKEESLDFIYELPGNYQTKNLPAIFCALELLPKLGFPLNETANRIGFENVIRLTGLKGRWQVLRENPLTIAESAHNEDGLRAAFSQITEVHHKKLIIVLAMTEEKLGLIEKQIFPKSAHYIFCKPDNPRMLDPEKLGQSFSNWGYTEFEIASSVEVALKKATQKATQEDLILITGSIFLVSEVV